MKNTKQNTKNKRKVYLVGSCAINWAVFSRSALLLKLILFSFRYFEMLCSSLGKSISKFALLGFSRNLREEMMPHNIKVTAVIPGAAYTDSWVGFVDPERIMEASDIAQLVYAAAHLSPKACVEDIVVRPQLGDL